MGVDYSGTKAAPRLDLGAAVMEFVDQASDFIGTRVAPVFKTKVKKANYSAITRETLTQTADTKRAARSNYNRGSAGAKDKSFSCEENGFEVPLDDSERALYATDFDAELAAVKIGTGIVLRNQEVRIATKLLDTAVFTGAALYTDVSAAPWTTAASDAIAQIRAARSKVRANCGMPANYVAMSATNRDRLIALTVVKDAVKYTSRTTEQELINALADLLGVQYVLVANSIKNSAKEKTDVCQCGHLVRNVCFRWCACAEWPGSIAAVCRTYILMDSRLPGERGSRAI